MMKVISKEVIGATRQCVMKNTPYFTLLNQIEQNMSMQEKQDYEENGENK